ncbi:MAG: dihydrodipicolinate reductase [Actinomycetes bacterium]
MWGTGNVGRPAIRAVASDPDLTLAAVVVSSEAKEGRDAADLAGLDAPTGVVAVRDPGPVLDGGGVDAVVYAVTGDTRPDAAVDDIVACLGAGADVVSTSVYPLIHPPSTPAGLRDRVESACAEGGASCWVSGIDPGFLADLLAPVLVATCVSVDRVEIRETFNYATYHAPHAVRELVGFGTSMDTPPPMLWPSVPTMVWGGVLRVLADLLGVELDEVDERIERRALERTIELPIGTFEAGTQGAFRLLVRGLVDGAPVIVVDHVTRIDDDCAPDWPHAPERSMGCQQVIVHGDPDVTMTVEAGDSADPSTLGDRNVGGIALSAGRIVHAVPEVIAAPNRIITAADLPLIVGRGLVRS